MCVRRLTLTAPLPWPGGGIRLCSSILPWRSCGTGIPGPLPPLPSSGAEAGTTPRLAGTGPTRSWAGGPCLRPSSGWDSTCPQPARHTRSRVCSAMTTSPPPPLGRQRHATASSIRRREPDLRPRRVRSRNCAPAPMTRLPGRAPVIRGGMTQSQRASRRGIAAV